MRPAYIIGIVFCGMKGGGIEVGVGMLKYGK
jgi:hypothetical protein